MKRRTFLKQFGIAAIVMGAGSAVGAQRADAADSASGTLSATVELNGRRYEYREDHGNDLGDFQGEGFVQRCTRATVPGLPLTVFFRPDRGTDRVEVVFELGRLWGAANSAAAHLGPYKATIFRGNRELASVDVPRHWWMSRWRWQSAPRPVIHSVDALTSSRLLLPMSADVARSAQPVQMDKCVYESPMDNAGIYYEMGDTGERYDIGPLTEWQAYYVNSGSDAALRAILAQAEAAGSIPTHYRDENTGAPIDFFQYPDASWYGDAEGRHAIKGYDSIMENGHPSGPWRMDESHYPGVSYLPYILTGDPYFLEELQFQGTQVLGWTAFFRALTKRQIVFPGQTRGYAWSLRAIFQLAKVTPKATPKWLKANAYWSRVLNDNKEWFTSAYLRNQSPASTVFHAATQLTSIAAWQEDFLALVFGWGVWMGFADWREIYLWKLQATLARTNGTSGWPRQYCSPYYYKIGRDLPSTFVDPAAVKPQLWFRSWKEAWDAFVVDPERAQTFVSGTPGKFTDETSYQETLENDYLIYTRGVLAAATQLGVKEAAEPYSFVDNMAQQRRYMTNRWAFAALSA